MVLPEPINFSLKLVVVLWVILKSILRSHTGRVLLVFDSVKNLRFKEQSRVFFKRLLAILFSWKHSFDCLCGPRGEYQMSLN